MKTPKSIKPSGKSRVTPEINPKSDYVGEAFNVFATQNAATKYIDKHLETPILQEHEIKEILKNPDDCQKIMIEKGKEFFKLNQPLVDEQTKDVVAFYSIANKKPFFFITPAEARLAIEAIKENRINIKEIQEIDKRSDQIVQTIMSNGILQFRPDKLEKPQQFSINNTKYNVCTNKPFASGGTLTLNVLNMMFAVVESRDLIANLVMVNAFTMATIRDWGKTIWDEATPKEVKQKKNYQGHIWTAEIYRNNQLGNNELWIGSIGNQEQIEKDGIDLYQFVF